MVNLFWSDSQHSVIILGSILLRGADVLQCMSQLLAHTTSAPQPLSYVCLERLRTYPASDAGWLGSE